MELMTAPHPMSEGYSSLMLPAVSAQPSIESGYGHHHHMFGQGCLLLATEDCFVPLVPLGVVFNDDAVPCCQACKECCHSLCSRESENDVKGIAVSPRQRFAPHRRGCTTARRCCWSARCTTACAARRPPTSGLPRCAHDW